MSNNYSCQVYITLSLNICFVLRSILRLLLHVHERPYAYNVRHNRCKAYIISIKWLQHLQSKCKVTYLEIFTLPFIPLCLVLHDVEGLAGKALGLWPWVSPLVSRPSPTQNAKPRFILGPLLGNAATIGPCSILENLSIKTWPNFPLNL